MRAFAVGGLFFITRPIRISIDYRAPFEGGEVCRKLIPSIP